MKDKDSLCFMNENLQNEYIINMGFNSTENFSFTTIEFREI